MTNPEDVGTPVPETVEVTIQQDGDTLTWLIDGEPVYENTYVEQPVEELVVEDE